MRNFWGAVVAKFATTTADGELEQESNLHILQKCSSGHIISYANRKGHSTEWPCIHDGGDEGDRTPDLLTASQALSQLSYAPVTRQYYRGRSSGMQGLFLGSCPALRVFLGRVSIVLSTACFAPFRHDASGRPAPPLPLRLIPPPARPRTGRRRA